MKELISISPIDGRYYSKVKNLSNYFSEYAYFKYRLHIEVSYFLKLMKTLKLPNFEKIFDVEDKFKNLVKNFSIEDAQKIKDIEKITNHDVKAVEYFFKDKMKEWDLTEFSEFVHFALTSQDINSSAIMLPIQECLKEEICPLLRELNQLLNKRIKEWYDIPILCRTHGQPAVPSTMGKEYKVFLYRLEQQTKEKIQLFTKFGGAVGNFNAHNYAYPDIDWVQFADEYISEIGLVRSKYTTQIENYDSLSQALDNLKRVNTILLDMCQDTWLYISFDYFKLKINENETGSSTMPHKVNPIDFENAEGNLLMANTLIEFFSRKLPISRLQRDLTDSTITRNLGTCVAHSMIAYKSILKGMGKLEINKEKISKDLENNWIVITEGIQSVLRTKGINGYEVMKKLARVQGKVTKDDLKEQLNELLPSDEVDELMKLTPFTYIGIV
jgi:adenylosuccinate lyase